MQSISLISSKTHILNSIAAFNENFCGFFQCYNTEAKG